jgi:hypothetical protein
LLTAYLGPLTVSMAELGSASNTKDTQVTMAFA